MLRPPGAQNAAQHAAAKDVKMLQSMLHLRCSKLLK
jgi:hypothetical protein